MVHSEKAQAAALAALTEYKQQIDAGIAAYCDSLLRTISADFGPYSREAALAFCSLLQRGGKRVRGALVITSYNMFGGTDHQVALTAARGAEMLHVYMLIIDDVCDRSPMRRGDATVHEFLARYHREHHLHGDAAHFGVSTALAVALVGC